MVITQVFRMRTRQGAKAADIIAIAKAAKNLILHHGAFAAGMDQVYFGTGLADWIFTARWPTFTEYGKAIESLTTDPAFIALMGELQQLVSFEERFLLNKIVMDD